MDLEKYAQAGGITITVGELPEGWWGSWNQRTRTITLLRGLGADQRNSVLAHELGHAAHNHARSTPATEREARAWAARALISPERVAATVKAMNWLGLLADELGVMPSDVAAYYASLTDHERLGIRDMIIMEPRGFGRKHGKTTATSW